MTTSYHDIAGLLMQRLKGKITPEGQQRLQEWIDGSPERAALVSDLDREGYIPHELLAAIERGQLRTTAILQARGVQIESASAVRPIHRMHFLRTAWLKYAAAILIVLSSLAYLWIYNRNDNDMTAASAEVSSQVEDVAPGGNRAVLTLADGTEIILDSAANGSLAIQGNVRVVKSANGQIIYDMTSAAGDLAKGGGEMMMNTMSTPKGGQYQLALPDGTKVWLNAASSITFPTSFSSKTRNVSFTGEAYFEVAKDREKPFVVDINGKSTVQVLGTSFNINSYADEGDIKTTLIEGRVKVSSVILNPGQQAIIGSSEQQPKVTSADIDQILAWKNGLFNFNGLDLRAVMRQLERWYDISVQYQGPVSNVIFRGEMYRNVHLSDVLEVLQKMGVKFRREGKILIVL